MESTNSIYQQLVIRYLNGGLSAVEEEKLFNFVKASTENERLFRQWESEWMASPKLLPEADKEWRRLQSRMSFRDVTVKATIHSSRRWMRVAVAVVIGLVLLSGGFFGTRYYDNQISSQNLFALETGMAEKTRMILADGTIVYLNAGSSLQYSGDFKIRHREVILSGEAYFEVVKLPGDIPFIVKTNDCDVVVKGTKFNLSAYPQDQKVSLALISGAVDIVCQDKRVAVSPGELVSLNRTTGQFSTENVQADQYMAWTEGRFEYDKISLQELADRLARKYDVNIQLSDQIKTDVVFHISLRNEETIEDILEALTRIVPVKYEKRHREIYIYAR